jgi:MerE protein
VPTPPPVGDPVLRPTQALVAPALERRGRMWLLWSFLLCPCHLPLSLGMLGAVLAGTSAGAVLRDHAWVAGTLLTVTWVAGTGYGFHLIRRSQRADGTCPVPTRRRR